MLRRLGARPAAEPFADRRVAGKDPIGRITADLDLVFAVGVTLSDMDIP
jgi:hypothetical protein